MPVYEYECSKCHHRFDAVRDVEDRDHAQPCEVCPYLCRRLPSLPQPPKLNGPGFHQNDYRTKEGRG